MAACLLSHFCCNIICNTLQQALTSEELGSISRMQTESTALKSQKDDANAVWQCQRFRSLPTAFELRNAALYPCLDHLPHLAVVKNRQANECFMITIP